MGDDMRSTGNIVRTSLAVLYQQRADLDARIANLENQVADAIVAGRTRNNPQQIAEHGTESGYTRHRRNGATPCAACKAAHSAAERGRKARRAEVA